MNRIGLNNGLMFRQVLNGSQEQVGTVAEAAKAYVAMMAQQGSDLSGGVAVIDGQIKASAFSCPTGFTSAQSADAVLDREHGVILLKRHAVFHLKIAVTSLFDLWSVFMGTQDCLHIGKVWIGRLKFSCSGMISRVFVAGSNVNKHAFVRVVPSAVSAWFKFPATWPCFDSGIISPIKSGVIFAPLMESIKRTFFAVVIESVKCSSFRRKIVDHFRVLASGTQSLSIRYGRHGFAESSPVGAQSFWRHFKSAEAANYIGVSGHEFSVARICI